MIGSDLYLVLQVRDSRRSVAFYRDVLGFSVREADAHGADFVHVRGGRLRFGLRVDAEHPGPDGPGQGVDLFLRADDVDRYHAEVHRRGGEPSEVSDRPFGWRTFTVRDPDGHRWSFYRPRTDRAREEEP